MSSFVGGKLKFKGEGAITKKKHKKSKKEGGAAAEKDEPAAGVAIAPVGGKSRTYEEEFSFETQRMASLTEDKVKSTPWGSSYRAPPTILHGYAAPLGGRTTTEEKLDLRCAKKSDKFCK